MNPGTVSGKQLILSSHPADIASSNATDSKAFENRRVIKASERAGAEMEKVRGDLETGDREIFVKPKIAGIASNRSAIEQSSLQSINDNARNSLQKLSELLDSPSSDANRCLDRKLELGRSRIKSVALVYDMLSKSAEMDRISMKDYISNLIDIIIRSNRISPNQASFKLKLDDIIMRPESAISCGLIINELITNLVEYDLSDGRKSEICIEFRSLGASIFRLTIRDNGSETSLGGRSALLRRALDPLVKDPRSGIVIDEINRRKAVIYFNELKYRMRFDSLQDRRHTGKCEV